VIVGHCCESGDLLTPHPTDPQLLQPRLLPFAKVGDLAVIEGTGAYCSSMSTSNYNSFPIAPEVLIKMDGSLQLIRQRQSMEQMLANEIPSLTKMI